MYGKRTSPAISTVLTHCYLRLPCQTLQVVEPRSVRIREVSGSNVSCFTVLLRAERQSARMSKITNDCLSQCCIGCFIAVPIWQQWASKG